MKTLQLVQGDPEWHAHRAAHFNASDAPAMLGVSPYKTRTQLLRELATGVAREFSDYVQERVIDPGHAFEANARAIAEEIIGEELYPCTGSEGRFSASFDGLTLMGDIAFEHKSMNAELRQAIKDANERGAALPEPYRVQMEQQCMVSGAERVLFMASRWSDEGKLLEEAHCWYTPDPALRKRIVAGWAQFERDLADYKPEPAAAPAPVARQVEGFGALSLRIEGRVLASNLDAFKAGAEAFIARLPKPDELQTDQDFADADAAVKACAEAESRIKAAKDAAQAQMADVDAAFRLADAITESIRTARLALDKAVKSEKEVRKAQIVDRGRLAVVDHYAIINATLGKHAIHPPQSLQLNIGAAIKGLRTIASITDAVDTAVASAKIEASQRAECVRACMAVLDAAPAADHPALFPDRVALCAEKTADDLRNLVAARIAEHEKREAARLEQERERIRKEEAEKLAREQAGTQNTTRAVEAEQQSPAAGRGMGDSTRELRAAGEPGIGIAKPTSPVARIKLGDINARIAPLSITADGLAQLGFRAVGTSGAAKLYSESDWPAICAALAKVIESAALKEAA